MRVVNSLKSTSTTIRTQYSRYDAALPERHTEEVQRLVGYLEYSRALALLDLVVSQSSLDEQYIMDDIVRSKPEFTIYTNLSRRVSASPTALDEAPAEENDTFARKGLAWVMALARVELGAMVAGFSDRADPFRAFPPTPQELPAYKEILLDSARSHYAALQNDPVADFFWGYRNRQLTLQQRAASRPEVNELQAIAYVRRAVIAGQMVEAVRQGGKGELTPAQAQQLAAWSGELASLRDVILYKVLGLGTTERTSQQTSTSTTERKAGWQGCLYQIEAGKKAMRGGKAKIIRTIDYDTPGK